MFVYLAIAKARNGIHHGLRCQGAFEVPYAEDLRRGVSKIIM